MRFRPGRSEWRDYVIASMSALVALGTLWWQRVSATQDFCALIDPDTAATCAATVNSVPAKMVGAVASLYVLHVLATVLGRLVWGYDLARAKNRASAVVFAVIMVGAGWILLFTDSFVAWFFGGLG